MPKINPKDQRLLDRASPRTFIRLPELYISCSLAHLRRVHAVSAQRGAAAAAASRVAVAGAAAVGTTEAGGVRSTNAVEHDASKAGAQTRCPLIFLPLSRFSFLALEK